MRFLDHTQLDTHAHTHTQPEGLLRTSDEPVLEAPTYTARDKHKRRKYVHSAGMEPAIPDIGLPQTYALDRTVTKRGRILHRIVGYVSVPVKVSYILVAGDS